MAAPEPHAKNLADLYNLAPLDWADVRRTLETNLTQEPGTGGPGHHTFWLSTIDADGRPAHDRRRRLLGRRPLLLLAAVRGRARSGTSSAIRAAPSVWPSTATTWRSKAGPSGSPTTRCLQRLAGVFAEGGWAPTVADGGFTHEFSAPSAGPPPWYVYEFTPDDAYAVATKEPGGATRWTF